MWSGFRTALLAATACAATGCVTAYEPPPWFTASMFEEIANAEQYSDFLAARYAGMAGEPAEAASFYRRSFDRSPEDASLLERAELATFVAGDAQEAVLLATGADPQVAAESPTTQLALAVSEIVANKHRRALARLRATSVGAINLDASNFLTAWLIGIDDPDGALLYLSQLPPRRLLAGEQLSMQGLVLLNAGRDDQALESFEQAARLPMNSPGYILSLRARLLAGKGDMAAARKLIEMQVEETGATAETEYVLSLINSGQPVTRPKLTVAQGAAIAVYLASAGGVARSSSEISAMRHSIAIYLDPSFAPSRIMLADALNEQGRDEDAVTVLREIKSGSPWVADARIQEAWILDRLERPAESLAAVEQALAASRRRDVLIGAADLQRVNHNDKQAAALYDEVISGDMVADLQDWRVLFARASARNALGDWKGAEADLVAALAVEPDRPEVQNFLGFGWINRGERVKEGMALIQKAVDARPDQGYIVDSLGWAHFKVGDYAIAVETLERAAELSPSDPEIIDHLGDAYWRTDRQTEAAFEWRRSLQLKPDPLREAALRTKLQSGLPPIAPTNLADAKQGRP